MGTVEQVALRSSSHSNTLRIKDKPYIVNSLHSALHRIQTISNISLTMLKLSLTLHSALHRIQTPHLCLLSQKLKSVALRSSSHSNLSKDEVGIQEVQKVALRSSSHSNRWRHHDILVRRVVALRSSSHSNEIFR